MGETKAAWHIGVDVGGTFTDFYVRHRREPAGPRAQASFHPRRSGPRHRVRARRAGPAPCRLPGSARAPRPRHHGGDERADPAPGRQGRAPHHRGLPGPAGDWPPDASPHVRSLRRLSSSAGAARAPPRGGRAHHRGGQGGAGAPGGPAGDGAAAGAGHCSRRLRGVPSLFIRESGARAHPGRSAATRGPRCAALPLLRGAAGVPRVRALFDHGPQRLPPAGHVALPRATRGRDRAQRSRRRARHQPVQRGPDVVPPRPGAAGAHRALRTGGRGWWGRCTWRVSARART